MNLAEQLMMGCGHVGETMAAPPGTDAKFAEIERIGNAVAWAFVGAITVGVGVLVYLEADRLRRPAGGR